MADSEKKGQRILIADDTLAILEFIGSVLRDKGYLINIAQDGERVLEISKKYKPDLILLDINMPGLDGYQTCEKLKATDGLKHIPVIFLSGLIDSVDKVKGFEVGAVDYITKPIDARELLARINIHLTISHLQKELEESNNYLEEKIAERTKDLNDKNSELRLLTDRFRSLVETITDWIWEVDENGVYTYVSPRVYDILGYLPEEMIGLTPFDLMPKDESAKVSKVFKHYKDNQLTFSNLENINKHKDGHYVVLSTSGRPIFDNDGQFRGYRGVDRDITEQKKFEDMMIQNEKMMSVGGLAAGMAHEINNPLAGILNSLQVMENRVLGDLSANIKVANELNIDFELIRKYMEKRSIIAMIKDLKESGYRIANIVRNMLSFARKGSGKKVTCDIRKLLDKTIEIATSDYDIRAHYDFKEILINREYQKNLPNVKCEESKVQQVFLNIIKNGADAMQEKSGEGYAPQFNLRIFQEESFLVVEIEDNGPGIEESVRKRIFEPFFTTKEQGKGTGLGMSVSYFIITENHNGILRVESEKGEWTKFIIKIPIENA